MKAAKLSYGALAQSGLPGGGQSSKGLPLDSGIPGAATFNKPEADVREFDKAEEGSIYRNDGPDDLAKPQNDQLGDERHHEQFKPTYAPPGGRPKDDTSLTRYPYRDGIPNTHSASADFVAELWAAEHARSVRFAPESIIKVALRLDGIIDGLNPKFKNRAAKCGVQLKRADIKNLRWIFSVDCGNGAKVVKMKGLRDGSITKLSKMDLDLTCSCPGWRWLGPEHHAKNEDYLDGKPRGTASVPVVRDPTGINRVCKHVAAVLSHANKWDVAKTKR